MSVIHLLVLVCLLPGIVCAAVAPLDHGKVIRALDRQPLSFVPNHGQAGSDVAFQAVSSGLVIGLGQSGVAIGVPEPSGKAHKKPVILSMRLIGAAKTPALTGEDKQNATVNFFHGNDPAKWLAGIPTYSRVRYHDVYPGIDFVYYGNGRRLEYDIVLQPGAKPDVIQVAFNGVTSTKIDSAGNLILKTTAGSFQWDKPNIYAESSAERKSVDGKFHVSSAGIVSFQIGEYDPQSTLVIDPSLSYSSFLGGIGYEECDALAIDGAGSAYLTGITLSANFLTVNPLEPAMSGTQDAFVVKVSPAGDSLIYSTFLGGSGVDYGHGIAVDNLGQAYVTGWTNSTDFPTTPGSFQPVLKGGEDFFITKLDQTGNAIIYSTFLGGKKSEIKSSIAIDSSGDAYVTGTTFSPDFPVKNPFQSHLGGACDAFIAELNSTGDALVYSSFLGGKMTDSGRGVAVDLTGAAYISGFAYSLNFPVVNAFQSTLAGSRDAFVTKVAPGGTSILYSTYVGGSGLDGPYQGISIAVNQAGNAYIAGYTSSANFPTANAYQGTLNGSTDAFVTALDPSGSQLVFSTYLGGAKIEEGTSIALDLAGNVYVTGHASSRDFPLLNFVQHYGASDDAFVSEFSPTGALLFSTYLGGSSLDIARGIAVDASGNIYVAGFTQSKNFPVLHPFQAQHGGGVKDAFVTKIQP